MSTHVHDSSEGGRDMAELLGGKGANLAEMARMGLLVLPGFTVTTEACRVLLATREPPAGAARTTLTTPNTTAAWALTRAADKSKAYRCHHST